MTNRELLLKLDAATAPLLEEGKLDDAWEFIANAFLSANQTERLAVIAAANVVAVTSRETREYIPCAAVEVFSEALSILKNEGVPPSQLREQILHDER